MACILDRPNEWTAEMNFSGMKQLEEDACGFTLVRTVRTGGKRRRAAPAATLYKRLRVLRAVASSR